MSRRFANFLVHAVAGVCAVVALGTLLAVIGSILVRGVASVNWAFLTRQMSGAGAGGGIAYNLLGTLILIVTAAVCVTPVAVGVALTHGYYLRSERLRRLLSVLLYVLNGVPSILFGLFGLIVFVKFLGWGKSWLAGGILLAMMILPTVTVSLLERIAALPSKYIEAAAGLGLSRSQIVRAVVLPQTLSGLVTGLLLGLARAAGETAPILFTATVFSGVTLPDGVRENPVLTLPYHIFILAQDSFDPAAAGKVWATAVVLLAMVFLLSLLALPLRWRVRAEV